MRQLIKTVTYPDGTVEHFYRDDSVERREKLRRTPSMELVKDLRNSKWCRFVDFLMRFMPPAMRRNILDRREKRDFEILCSDIESRDKALNRKWLADQLRQNS